MIAVLFILLFLFAVMFLAVPVQWLFDRWHKGGRVIDEAPFPALPQTTESSNVVVLPRQGVQR